MNTDDRGAPEAFSNGIPLPRGVFSSPRMGPRFWACALLFVIYIYIYMYIYIHTHESSLSRMGCHIQTSMHVGIDVVLCLTGSDLKQTNKQRMLTNVHIWNKQTNKQTTHVPYVQTNNACCHWATPMRNMPLSTKTIEQHQLPMPLSNACVICAAPAFDQGSYKACTPSPPTKSFPTKSPWVKLSGRLPIKFDGHENSHPLELRVCSSQTLWNPNS